MKKLAYILLIFIIFQHTSAAQVDVYIQDNKFGLKEDNNIITKAKYKKLVRLGTTSWIMQDGNKFGVISNDGTILVEPKYTKAERVLGKYVKVSKGEKYGIYDEMGFDILPVEYSSIDLLYGGMFVTCKNYKYGITDLNGQVILDNIFDDIYMPNFNTMIFVYNGKTYQIEKNAEIAQTVPFDLQSIRYDFENMTFTEIVTNPIAATGYYGVTMTDYVLKLVSSISPAYEKTIDELMFSQGADTVNVLKQFSWLPKFPFVYAKKYYSTIADPYNGPLGTIKKNLKQRVKE